MEFSSLSSLRTSHLIATSIFNTRSKTSNWRYLIATCNMVRPSLSMCSTAWGNILSISLTISMHPDLVARNNGVISPIGTCCCKGLDSLEVLPYLCWVSLLVSIPELVTSHEVSFFTNNLASSNADSRLTFPSEIHSLRPNYRTFWLLKTES